MSDVIAEEKEGAPVIPDEFNFTPAQIDDFDVIVDDPDLPPDEPEEYQNLKRDELIAQIEQNRKLAEEAAQYPAETGVEVNKLNETFESLTERLNQMQAPAVQPPQNQMSEEEFRAKFEEQMSTDPTKAMDLYLQKKIAPEIHVLMRNNLKNSERFLYLDPERKDTAKRYQSEITAEISTFSPQDQLSDPDVYQKAHDRVLARHINDVMEDRVGAAVEAKLKELGIGSGEAPKPQYSEPGVNQAPPPKEKGKRIEKITPQEKEAIQQRAFLRGTTYESMERSYIRNGRKFQK